MGVSTSTIETHRRNVMRKLDLHSVAELTKYDPPRASPPSSRRPRNHDPDLATGKIGSPFGPLPGVAEFLGFVDERQLLYLYARCRGVVYTPFDEDYGYVTVEAFLSRKPVVTVSDSGGPLEFVEDGVSGLVAAPSPEPLAYAFRRLWELKETRLAELGAEGARRVAPITWDAVVDSLTEAIR